MAIRGVEEGASFWVGEEGLQGRSDGGKPRLLVILFMIKLDAILIEGQQRAERDLKGTSQQVKGIKGDRK